MHEIIAKIARFAVSKFAAFCYAVAVGVAGVFIETHQDPDNAPSDGPNMIPIADLPSLLEELMALDAIAKRWR